MSMVPARIVRWNLAALMLDVTCFAIGMAFLDSSAVLPLLMERLGATGPLIGAFAALRSLAFSVFQIFVAYGTHGRPRQKPPLVWVATITRLPLLLLPVVLLRAADSPAWRNLALWSTIVILVIWTLGDGLGYIPWAEIVARSFDNRIRGRFFATTQAVSGLASIAIAALLVRSILHSSSLPYPRNYALLGGLAALLFHISLVGVFLLREPPPPADPGPPLPPLRDYFAGLPRLVRGNPIFARLSAIQLLVGAGGAAAPFYVLYATQRFHLGDEWGGWYQAALAVGVVALMPLWTWLGERHGPAAAVRGVATACLLTPLLALTVGRVSPYGFALVFALMGGSLGWALGLTMDQYLLTHLDASERSIYIALFSLLFAPSALYPFLGGLLVRGHGLIVWHGIPLLFVLTALVVALGLLTALRLPDPSA